MKINESPHSETIYWMMVIYWCLEHTSKQVLPKDYKPYLIAFSIQYFVVAAVPSNALGSFGSWRCWNEQEGSVRCVGLQSWREKKRTGPAGGDTVSWEEAAGDGWPQGENIRLCLHAAPAQFLLLLHLLTDGSRLCGRCRYHCHRISPPVQTLKGLY